LNFLTPCEVLIGVLTLKTLANTLYTFPSTTASGSLKQIEEIAEAV
jgi:hypothetical protein